MDKDQGLLLNHLDRPLRLLGVCKDEALALMVPIFVGLFSGYGLLGLVVGIASVSFLKMLKKQNEGAHLVQIIYWHLPTSRKHMQLYIPSYIREYVG